MTLEPPPVVDDLSAPLGQHRKPRRRLWLPRAIVGAVAAALAAIVLCFGGWTAVVHDPLGGEPIAIVSLKAAPDQLAKADPASGGAQAAKQETPVPEKTLEGAAEPAPAAAPGTQTVTIIDGMSGKRQQVTIAAPAAATATSPAIAVPSSSQQLMEETRHGPIPKIGTDGARPSEIYAANQGSAAGGPRVAIVVGRLGISASATAEALAKLPTSATLGFVPYGRDLDRWVARARGEGREVLLQVPMEPFDHPHNDGGPQSLLTTLAVDQNIDRLHWSMSRFQNYVGLASYMGARFTSNETAMTAVMREAGKRGLLYFDDGSNPRSVAGKLAAGSQVPFAEADVVIHAVPTAARIDAALARLEVLARERGIAVGYADALPVAIEHIAKWAAAAETRGIVLVPITAVTNKPKSS